MLNDLIVVSHKYPPYASGGLAPFVERCLAALRARHPELPVVLFTMNVPGDLPRTTVLDDGLRVERLPLPGVLNRNFLSPRHTFARSGRFWFAAGLAWFNLGVIASIMRRRRGSGTLVDIQEWQSSPAGLVAACVLRMPVVYHVHSTELTMIGEGKDPFGLIRRFERAMARHARAVLVPTSEMRTLLVDHGWPAEKIRVVTYGYENPVTAEYLSIGPERRRQDADRLRTELGIGRRTKVVVFAGRLSPVKGILTLVRAMDKVVRVHADCKLVVLGVGFPGTGESADVHRAVDELGLSDSVHVYDRYLPQVEVARHYDMADVCVFPSTYEPFGLVSIEAMSQGRPTVLGPGFSRVICHDDDGPVVLQTTRDESDELADSILRVLDDPVAAAAIAARGQRHVTEHLNWDQSIRTLVCVLRDAVDDRRGARQC
jgi:glycosyltransferase involved in cell wall biosynthesis